MTFVPALVWVWPFVVLLLAIAILPLAAPHFWESNLRKLAVSAGLAAPVLWLYLNGHPDALRHAASDYVSFIVLLGSLFVISGGVYLDGDLPRDAAREHHVPRRRRADCVGRRDDRRVDADDPAAAAHQQANARRSRTRSSSSSSWSRTSAAA